MMLELLILDSGAKYQKQLCYMRNILRGIPEDASYAGAGDYIST